MSETDIVVPATEANRAFSKLLRAARAGRRVTITSYGEPVAVLMSAAEADAGDAEREPRRKAMEELEAHWATLEPKVIGPWTREELYERD